MTTKMLLLISLPILILSSQISPLPLLHPNPYPATIIQPSLPFPTTIPAFPAQSASSSSCPLHLSDDLIASISASCSPLRRLPSSRTRCCPSLAAALYSAYAASALSSSSGSNLPALPDDSEACAGAAERAIIERGVKLPRVNETCGAAYCYCGIRLRRLSCGFAAAAEEGGGQGKWAPRGEWARRLEKHCARPGLAGCSLCLRTLNQLKGTAGNVSLKGVKSVIPRDNDCQLMGLTWLLSRNRTRYLPAATAVFRAFMATEGSAAISDDGKVGPTTCHQIHDEMPIAVGSSQINDDGKAELSAASVRPTTLLLMAYSLLHVVFFLSH